MHLAEIGMEDQRNHTVARLTTAEYECARNKIVNTLTLHKCKPDNVEHD